MFFAFLHIWKRILNEYILQGHPREHPSYHLGHNPPCLFPRKNKQNPKPPRTHERAILNQTSQNKTAKETLQPLIRNVSTPPNAAAWPRRSGALHGFQDELLTIGWRIHLLLPELLGEGNPQLAGSDFPKKKTGKKPCFRMVFDVLYGF